MPAQAKLPKLPKTRKAPKADAAPVSSSPDATPVSSAPDETRSAGGPAQLAAAPVRPAAPTVETVAEGLLFEATLFDKSATQGGRLKAWELLGKHLGMFKDRKDEGESVVVHFDIAL